MWKLDTDTLCSLIEDKITYSDCHQHLGSDSKEEIELKGKDGSKDQIGGMILTPSRAKYKDEMLLEQIRNSLPED